MTPALRKYHRIVWYCMAAILPLFYVSAILSIPKSVPDQRAHSIGPEALPVVIRSKSTDEFDVTFRADAPNLRFQLEILVRKPMPYPEAVVYAEYSASGEMTKRALLGKLSSIGPYRFELDTKGAHGKLSIDIMDPIKNRTIQHFEL